MRIVVCDYSGHPFQAQLSRELARRGHETLHIHFAEFQTPKGRLSTGPGDPPMLAMEAVSLGKPFAKNHFVKRRFQEVAVGRLIAARMAAHRPDVVVACNLPLDTLKAVLDDNLRTGLPVVFWQQDIYSRAIDAVMRRKLGPLGAAIGAYYKRLEGWAARSSAAVVAIAEDFRPTLERDFGVPASKIHVVQNWAPLDEITPRPKINPWSMEHDLSHMEVVLYTGTLGLKHDPGLILAAAEALRARPDARVVVASEGPAVAWLKEQAASRELRNLMLLPFQPFERYSDVLASAEVVISILEAEAACFSVPSKVLSYLCAGRPIVLSAPEENLAARIVAEANAGSAVPAGDPDAFCRAVTRLLADPAMRDLQGRSARRYAEEHFDIARLGDRFERILCEAAGTAERRDAA